MGKPKSVCCFYGETFVDERGDEYRIGEWKNEFALAHRRAGEGNWLPMIHNDVPPHHQLSVMFGRISEFAKKFNLKKKGERAA